MKKALFAPLLVLIHTSVFAVGHIPSVSHFEAVALLSTIDAGAKQILTLFERENNVSCAKECAQAIDSKKEWECTYTCDSVYPLPGYFVQVKYLKLLGEFDVSVSDRETLEFP